MKKLHLIISLIILFMLLTSCITIQKTSSEPQENNLQGTATVKSESTYEKPTQNPLQNIPTGMSIIEEQRNEPKEYILKGDFEDRARGAKGSVYIIEERGQRYLMLSEDFETTRTNNLKILLAKKGRVFIGEDLYKGGYFNVGELERFEGKQYYEIPKEVDLREYQSVAIHSFAEDSVSGNARLFS